MTVMKRHIGSVSFHEQNVAWSIFQRTNFGKWI